MTESVTESSRIHDLRRIARNFDKAVKPDIPAILNWTADSARVLNWYYSQDPLDEMEVLRMYVARATFNPALINEFIASLEQQSEIQHHCSATLIAQVVAPQVVSANPTGWHEQLERELLAHPLAKNHVRTGMKPDTRVLISYLFARLATEKPQLNYEQLQNLFIGGEMLFSLYYPTEFNFRRQEYTNEDLCDGEAKQHIDRIQGFQAFEVVRQYALANLDKGPEYGLLALKAALVASSHGIGSHRVLISEQKGDEFRDHALRLLVKDFGQVFMGKHGILNQNPDSKEMAGRFHELVWGLDANVYLSLRREANLCVAPTGFYQDKPLIGRPFYNRGFDYFLMDLADPAAIKPVQLKSRARQNKRQPYHEEIIVVHEKNFQGYDAMRLGRKLNTYMSWVESGHDQRLVPQVSAAILPTVVETIENFRGKTNGIRQRWGITEDLTQLTRPGNRRERREAILKLRRLQKRTR